MPDPANAIPTAVTIGNFDGVHLGHAALVHRARDLVGARGRVVAVAFDPHPFTRLRPAAAPARLTGFTRRVELLMAAGADEVVRLEPTDELLATSPEAFMQSVRERHAPSWLVEGPDFHFGKGRAGGVLTLARLGRELGYATIVVDPVEVALGDHLVARASSSLVRWLVTQGRVRDAALVLGRPYELAGEVRRGDRRGRTIGFPTANLATDCLLPADGVYAATATLPGGGVHRAAVNVGARPTFSGVERRTEVHLLDLGGSASVGTIDGLPEYDWPLTIRLESWLRDQVRFESVHALSDQLARDVHRVRDLLPTPTPA